MATITSMLPQAAIPHSGIKRSYVMRNRLNFLTNPVANGDVVQALNIPAGTIVQGVFTRVITAEGAACTATVGDGAAAAAWDASVNLNAAAGTMTAPSAALTEGAPNTYADVNAPAGKLYSAADTIDLTMGAAAANAVFDIYAVCIDLNP